MKGRDSREIANMCFSDECRHVSCAIKAHKIASRGAARSSPQNVCNSARRKLRLTAERVRAKEVRTVKCTKLLIAYFVAK